MFLLFLLLILFPLASQRVLAQSQEGSVAIAEAIRPQRSAAEGFSTCVGDLKKTGTPDKDARKDCLELAMRELKSSEKVANEAADATKASRPVVIRGYGNYSGYGYYSRPIRLAREPRPARAPRQRVSRYAQQPADEPSPAEKEAPEAPKKEPE